jgi:hypothetical protein
LRETDRLLGLSIENIRRERAFPPVEHELDVRELFTKLDEETTMGSRMLVGRALISLLSLRGRSGAAAAECDEHAPNEDGQPQQTVRWNDHDVMVRLPRGTSGWFSIDSRIAALNGRSVAVKTTA